MNPEDYESLPTSSVTTIMTAGAIAGVMEHCVMYPLDSVKTRMQSLAPSTVRAGISETFLRMVKTEGLLRPVRGLSAMVIGAGPSHALYFSTYEYSRDFMIKHTTNSKYHSIIHGVCGCVPTILHDGVMNPAEVVKQRLQMYGSPYKSAINCMIHVYQKEGIRAFYRSYTTQLTMNIPFQSIHFMVYEYGQTLTNAEGTYNPPAHMISGAAAGAIAAAITTPLDVCKTLLNTQQVGFTRGMLEAVKTVYRLGGPTGYFRGLQARVMYQMPATAICWSTYEFFKYILGHNRLEDVRYNVTIGNDDEQQQQQQLKETLREEKMGLKPRELPAMSGAGIYGSISFNTMHHTTDSSFNRIKDKPLLDISHT